MGSSALILYHISDFKKEKRFTTLCKKQGLQVRSVKEKDAKTPVGVLAGILPGGAYRPTAVSAGKTLPELLVFSGLSMEQMERFLDAYKEAGLEPVALKARLTPTNISWTLEELAAELGKEHKKMEKNR